jgi:hypothetical protein
MKKKSRTTQICARPAGNAVSEREIIAEIAYFIWLSEGCPEGCTEEHWRQAELLHSNHGESGTPSQPPS